MNRINLLTLSTRLPGWGWGVRGPARERGREGSARDSLTRFWSSPAAGNRFSNTDRRFHRLWRALERETEEEAFSWGRAGGWQ